MVKVVYVNWWNLIIQVNEVLRRTVITEWIIFDNSGRGHLHATLKMTSTEVVEASFMNNSLFQGFIHQFYQGIIFSSHYDTEEVISYYFMSNLIHSDLSQRPAG